MKVAFIGLGNMGLPMASRLAAAGHQVAGFDVSADIKSAATKAGLAFAKNALEAVADVDAVFTMLPNGRLAEAVFADVASGIKSGTLYFDCSTIDVETARRIGQHANRRGIRFMDAPVSGGVGGAAGGTLTFMVGGDVAVINDARALLDLLGKKIVHCGDVGSGQTAKICNNMIAGISMVAVSEAFAIAERLGLSPQTLFDVASTSSGQCWALTTYCPYPGLVEGAPAGRNYEGGFATQHMLKDLRLAEEAAMKAGVSSPLGALAANIYSIFAATGEERSDFSAVIKLFQNAANKASNPS